MTDAYRVTADVITPEGATKVSFIVQSGAGWKWAVEQAHGQLESVTVIGEARVDQIWPGDLEQQEAQR